MISEDNDHFSINIPLIPMDNGKFKFDEKIKRVMIDIGTSWNAPNSVRWLNRHPENSVVIGCEPSDQEYCTVKAINKIIYEGYKYPDQWFPQKYKEPTGNVYKQHDLIKQYTKECSLGGGKGGGGKDCPYMSLDSIKNFYMLPVAVGNENCYKYFNTAGPFPGTGSLLESKHQNNGKVLVPIITLNDILQRIPFEYVEFLKIDAQGNDELIIQSAGELIKKCAVVAVEILCGEYKNEVGINIMKYMKNNGFKLIDSKHGCNIFLNILFEHLKDNLDYDLVN